MLAEPDNRKNPEGNPEGNQGGISQAADAVLADVASRLRGLLEEMAPALKPFPPFLNMVSIQALELEPPFGPPRFGSNEDRGCVVVAPDGTICSLDLRLIPGAPGETDSGQMAELHELDLPPEEYIVYAVSAVRALGQEMRRRGL